jgi:hypothetical protein
MERLVGLDEEIKNCQDSLRQKKTELARFVGLNGPGFEDKKNR